MKLLTTDSPFKTVKEVSKLLRIGESKTYELIAKGILGHHRIGGSLRITDEQISDYLERTRQEPTSPEKKKGPRQRLKEPKCIKVR